MDFKFLFYVFISIVFILGGTYNYFKKGEQVAASIFFMGAMSACLYFGFRWFTPAGEARTDAPGSWPPAINYCPDFMILDAGGGFCIDTIGVSKGKEIGITTGGASPTEEVKQFPLELGKTGKDRVDALCKLCGSKGVTWEGVWNGFVCIGNDPPRPPAA
jgi:hypothetical protein